MVSNGDASFTVPSRFRACFSTSVVAMAYPDSPASVCVAKTTKRGMYAPRTHPAQAEQDSIARNVLSESAQSGGRAPAAGGRSRSRGYPLAGKRPERREEKLMVTRRWATPLWGLAAGVVICAF